MLKASFSKYTLLFKQASGTSRGIYTQRDSWFIKIFDTEEPNIAGIGECAPLPGLSPELKYGFLEKLAEVCSNVEQNMFPAAESIEKFPSIRMGIEMAFRDFENKGKQILFPSEFTNGSKGIHINGLVWMGTPAFMQKQVCEKLEQGYNCIKLKIGALDFDTELALISDIRKTYNSSQVQIRVDANGAFTQQNVFKNLEALAKLQVHSIEQPIQPGQLDLLKKICLESPIPIALDEELIDYYDYDNKAGLIAEVRPHFLILKPSLHGGFSGCNEWIDIAEKQNCSWWVTSALESNIGLNAIAQWTATLNNNLHQGLGTGQLFSNNFECPLYIKNGELWYNSISN